ncbi:hypothetical protein ACFUV2_32485 [Streptomyces pilosus]|uniref:hypothetical protein n=1 Tax=Streptomyces pilosus TaxID=28893 RepID=UPI003639CBC9
MWFDAWLRVRQAALARQEADGREELKQLESVVADNDRGQVSQETAVRMLRKASFDT